MIELQCARPDFWNLSPAEHAALVRAWKRKLTRDGCEFPKEDTPEQRKSDQSALAAALSAFNKANPL